MVQLSADEYKKLIESYVPKPEEAKEVERKYTPISDWCKHYAIILGDTGKQIKILKIKYSNLTFNYKEGSYNFKPEEATFLKISGFWSKKKYYLYNINNPDPLKLNSSGIEAVIDAKVYKAILENTHVKDLNALADGAFIALIKKYWWLILLLGVVVWYFSSGQDLFGSNNVVTTTQNLTGVRR